MEQPLKAANRQPLGEGWTSVLAAYPGVTRKAASNTALATTIAPVVALFKQAPRDVSAATRAATDGLAAVKSNNRTAKVVSRANASKQRATALTPPTEPIPTIK